MKTAFRMFLRGSVYYVENTRTGEQKSLKTKDKAEASRLLESYNQATENAALNRELGRIYLRAASPKMATRTWQEVMDDMSSKGIESTQARCKRAMASNAFNPIRNLAIAETTAEDFKLALKRGGAAANHYLRRLQNLALENGWLGWHIIPPKKWEKPPKTQKRGINFDEHCHILESESNQQKRDYYQMLWLTGAAQTDCSLLKVENIDWKKKTLSYQRKKTGQWCLLSIGADLEALLVTLPKEGFLFPHIATLSDKDRSAEFCRRCRVAGVSGVSLHSYRYAWAERAAAAGYPERFAQAALGHGSKAVHRAYARGARIICPPLENNGATVIPFAAVQQKVA